MKDYITDINEELEWCPCGTGCHLCSGTARGFGSIYDYFKYWKQHPDARGQSFQQWIYQDIPDYSGYAVTAGTLQQLENKYKEEN